MLFKHLGLRRYEALSLLELSIICREINEYDLAFETNQKCISIFQEVKDDGSLGFHGVNPISGLGVKASAGSRGTCSG
ncbi:hypothetical protein MNBD_CHLOROFLEXI01-1871 [hydrothermal vent metagenome]|uniref:Uncharacterized protein n=1 Tax=hydrothermal vent metagenome TaxID=652676 RepID=A0A3B0VJF1_9ZZZZ